MLYWNPYHYRKDVDTIKHVIQAPFAAPPYSLHDAQIIGMQTEDNILTLLFDYGYIETTPPYGQVQGTIRISGIQWDFCHMYLLEYTDVLCGNYGHFQGKKLPLQEFITTAAHISINVIDETYGYHQLKLSGFLSAGTSVQECILEICYTDPLCYLIEET